MARLLFVLAITGGALGIASPAEARVETESPYTLQQTFNGALRYLRVDLGFEVLERDFEAGYLLFKYVGIPGQNPSRGAIEVIEVNREVKVIVQLPEEPSHHETVLSDGLMKKLETEYGEPPRSADEDPAGDEDDSDDSSNSGDEDRKAEDDTEEGEPSPPPSKRTRRRPRRRLRRP